MPIFFQQDIDAVTRLAVWKIEEAESFFTDAVPLQRDITHPHKRLQHLAGRYLLQYLFPDFPISLIRIADTRKPFLEDEAYHFSISHCGDYAAVIVSQENRVGIDIEIPNGKIERIRQKFLHAEELAVNTGSDLRQLTLLWSCKEAMFKWWGLGQVDFSEMLRLDTFPRSAGEREGSLSARFLKGSVRESFPVRFQLFDEVVMAWVSTLPLKADAATGS
ncbi:MAG TPA: 4'-phosphopantetheinyl transferase superfamily protein [Flavisolibacter sp.]|nr:4'-phosphopantetheinyl transferase superfamily protein [Flavisolibacter sp.]